MENHTSDRSQWPGYTGEAHPDVYTSIPPQTAEMKCGQLSDAQLKQFFEEGFLLIEDYFTEAELQPSRDDIKEAVEQLARKLYKGKKIKSLYKEYGLFQRLSKIEKDFPGANIVLHKMQKLPQGFRDILQNERVLNIMEQLLGTQEIGVNPIWNIRTKTPNNEASTVPWHQDNAYTESNSYKVMIVTAWIPLLDTNATNGCMQFVRRGHRLGKVAMHQCCHGGTWYVMLEPEEMEKELGVNMTEDVVTVPVPYKGMVLFNNMTPHHSLNNHSSDIRWSMDLRWQRMSDPACFWGLKKACQVRSADPKFKVDWEVFDSVNRGTVSAEAVGHTEEEFDTTIQGPWMKKWEITHINRHIRQFEKTEKSGEEAKLHVVG